MERGRRACESKEHRKLSIPANSKSQLFGKDHSIRNTMKKLLFAISLTLTLVTSVLADGTIQGSPGAFFRFQLAFGDQMRHPTVADGFTFGIFYGSVSAGLSRLTVAPQLATVSPTTGLVTGWPLLMSLPGTNPGDEVFLQVRAWSELYPMEFHSNVGRVTLMPEAGPGAVIWTLGSTPGRITPILYPVPEPSTLALSTITGLALALSFRRRINNRN